MHKRQATKYPLTFFNRNAAHQQSPTSTEAVVTEATEPAVAEVEGETGENPSEEDNPDNEGGETAEKLLSAPKEYEEVWLVEEEKENLPLPTGEDKKIEENEAVADEAKSSFSTIGEGEEDGQDEGVDADIEEVSHSVDVAGWASTEVVFIARL